MWRKHQETSFLISAAGGWPCSSPKATWTKNRVLTEIFLLKNMPQPCSSLRCEFLKGELSLLQSLQYSFAVLNVLVSLGNYHMDENLCRLKIKKKFFPLTKSLPPPRWAAGPCLIGLEFFKKRPHLEIWKTVHSLQPSKETSSALIKFQNMFW